MTAKTVSEKKKKRRVTFTFNAPDAEQVVLVGDFNRWNEKKHQMKKKANGTWKKDAVIPTGKYEYKFLVDGRWQMDPRNGQVCSNCFGSQNNIVEVKK